MSRSLLVMQDWGITPDASGGAAALIYSHLELMVNECDEVGLLILKIPGQPLGFDHFCETQPERWQQISSWCSQIHIQEMKTRSDPKFHYSRLRSALFDPETYYYGSLLDRQEEQNLKNFIINFKPDLLWAEHLLPAILVKRLNLDLPIVYSHHDWHWKIKSHRNGQQATSIKQKMRMWASRRIELELVRQVAACVSGSQTELDEMRYFGAKATGYFPTTYAPVDLNLDVPIPSPARIVHLGGMQTTANRLGLLRFLDVCWPELIQKITPVPELWVVGDLDGAVPELGKKLEQDGIVCTGVVEDLKTILRPFDLHIVPWEYNTGTRTRIPLVLNHGQVLVSTSAAAACLPELISGQNCILVDDLAAMTIAIRQLYRDAFTRKQISKNGHETFLSCFTAEAQYNRYALFFDKVISSLSI